VKTQNLKKCVTFVGDKVDTGRDLANLENKSRPPFVSRTAIFDAVTMVDHLLLLP
jgi:hypothetical protein